MKRFFAHLSYALLVLPVCLIVFGVTYCSLRAETMEQSGVLYGVTVRDLTTGDVRREEYKYNQDFTEVTCTYTLNDQVTETKTWAITPEDPLITDTFEILPHPTAVGGSAERIENEGYVTIHYVDDNGELIGWSEITYEDCNRLACQHDFAADGTVLQTTTRGYMIYYGSDATDTE